MLLPEQRRLDRILVRQFRDLLVDTLRNKNRKRSHHNQFFFLQTVSTRKDADQH